MTNDRPTPINIESVEFKRIAHALVEEIGDFLQTIRQRPLTTAHTPKDLQEILGARPLPAQGTPPAEILTRSARLLMDHSLHNGHPKFMGYITSSAAPIGMLADLLAASVNPNVGGQILSPMATEIEKQTVQWLSEFIGVGPGYGGLLVSGGNMANFTGFLAARTAKAPKNIKEEGMIGIGKQLITYCSKTTHTWVDKAAILFGHGSKQTRWIPADDQNRMDVKALEETIKKDLAAGHLPFLVVGTAGDVSTGAVDDLDGIGDVCERFDLWFHIDGAYGAPAAVVPELATLFKGIKRADSIALDPHKWLYSPLEAGCTLVKDPKHLIETFSSHPEYYNFSLTEEGESQNYFEFGFQNSRGFRALKVWMALQQVGREGYIKMIKEDIALSELMFSLADAEPELAAVSQHLSICTLRFNPKDLEIEGEEKDSYLNTLNEALCKRMESAGELFLSNAIVKGQYCMRACIVNFRTSKRDIEEIIAIVLREGRLLHTEMQLEKF